jgi:hypothetical protein
MRSVLVIAGIAVSAASAAGAAPFWTVERSEIAYLFYGEPSNPVLTISCGQAESETVHDETRIQVEVEKGTKPTGDKVALRIEQDKGHKDVALEPLICGVSKCQDRPDGEVYRYVASTPGKDLALDIAHKARTISIDAPGAKISAPADDAAFKKFAVSCLNW